MGEETSYEERRPYVYKSYKNVYKKAFIFGLPSEMFYMFLGLMCIVLLLTAVAQSIVFALGCIVFLGGVYGGLWALVEKYGIDFFQKLLARYTDQSFEVVRKNRQVKNILKK